MHRSYGWLLVTFSLARAEHLTLSLSLGVTPANIAINDISLKLDSVAYISTAESTGVSSTTFTYSAPKATEFGEITRRLVLLCRSRLSNVTKFSTNRNLICDFLLGINTNLAPILHRFWDIAFDRSKIAIFGYTPLVFNSPDDLRKILSGCQQMASIPNDVETLPKISIAWVGRTNVTDRQTTDRQTDGRWHIANVNVKVLVVV